MSRASRSTAPSTFGSGKSRLLAAAAITLVAAACAPIYDEQVSVMPPVQTVDKYGELAPAGTGPVVAPAAYRINPGDTIELKFPQLPAYSNDFVVGPGGKITVPWLGAVTAAGKTAEELQRTLSDGYAQLWRHQPPPAKRRYLLDVDDQLEIRFPFSPEFNAEIVVRPDGRISLPLVKTVIAEGRTPEQLQAELVRRYSRHMANPELVVMVKQQTSRVYEYDGEVRSAAQPGLIEVALNIKDTIPLLIYVGGEVTRPGLQPYRGAPTALQAVLASGGPQTTADMRSVVILRRGANDKPLFIVRNLENDLAGQGTSDIVLRPFDVVVVPRSKIARVGDALDQYLYRLVRPLANSSIGFFFTKQIGTSNVDQQTTIAP